MEPSEQVEILPVEDSARGAALTIRTLAIHRALTS